MNNPAHTKFRGIITLLVTPLIDNDTLDRNGLERLIEHTIAGGVSGLFILGTTGEFPGLSHSLKHELIELTCGLVNKRVPVMVGISDTSFTETVHMASLAETHGADAAVVTAPYYFNISQKDMLLYLKNLLARIALPVFLYNMPVQTKFVFEAETVKEASNIPGIIGMKDSSSDLAYFKQIQHLFNDPNDFICMIGPEEIMPEFVLMGGHGGLNGGSNMFPRLFVDLYKASVDRDFDKIVPLQKKVIQISSTIYRVGDPKSSYLRGLKCALSLLGLCGDVLAEPLHKFGKEEKNTIQKFLDDLNYRDLI